MGPTGSRGGRWIAAGLMGSWLAAGLGCATAPDARYVYQDGEYGVIGIPRNSPYGRKDYNRQAQELMNRHFPGGYEIVRAEEVVEGERTLDKAIKKELDTEPGFTAFSQMLKLGKIARSSSIDEKDVTHITESRIIYRRRPEGKDVGLGGFSLVSNQAPRLYLDPNDLARKMDREAMMVATKLESAKDPHKDKPADPGPDDKKAQMVDARPKDDALLRASAPAPAGN